jgi:hypothetical protein
MEILIAYAVLATIVALYYRDKAKESESLFELSKGYSNEYMAVYNGTTTEVPPKLNKDGSIAKKRGREPKA